MTKRARDRRRQNTYDNKSIFLDYIAAQIDPNQLQPGQSLYETQTGDEVVVLEADPTSTSTVVMPADQTGTGVPEDVKTVEDADLTMQYDVTDPQTETVEAEVELGFRNKASSLKDIRREIGQSLREVNPNLDADMDASRLKLRVDEPPSKPGYMDVMLRYQDLKAAGADMVDALLVLREEFDEGLVESVLTSARDRGRL